DCPIRSKLARGYVACFSNIDAHFASPIQQNAIKFLATYLICLRPRDLSHVGEVNVPPALSIMREQSRTPFRRKTRGLNLPGHAQSRERIVRSRQQRFTDMKSRKGLTLEQDDRMTVLR